MCRRRIGFRSVLLQICEKRWLGYRAVTHRQPGPWDKICAALMAKQNGIQYYASSQPALKVGLDYPQARLMVLSALQPNSQLQHVHARLPSQLDLRFRHDHATRLRRCLSINFGERRLDQDTSFWIEGGGLQGPHSVDVYQEAGKGGTHDNRTAEAR